MKLRTYAILGLLLGACNTPIELGNRDAQGGSDQGVGGNATDTGGQKGAGGQQPSDSSVGGQATIWLCGNGTIESGETCDDGNTFGNDGCSAGCAVEGGFVCATPGQLCSPLSYCGDGKLTASEVCDDGNVDDGDGCAANCRTIEAGWGCAQPGKPCSRLAGNCGDGLVQAGEQCDLGALNGAAGSTCARSCQLKPASCGNGIIEKSLGETCDDTINDGSYGGCTPSCQQAGYCGDEILNGPEQCDNGVANVGSYNTCSPVCQLGPHCGDGIVQAEYEECDDGINDGRNGCSLSCEISRIAACGNGVVEAGEECDYGFDQNVGSYGGCTPNCKVGPFCGDGILNGPAEECDNGSQNGSAASMCSKACLLLLVNTGD